jgi:F420-0:gamma-glutamyl ligase
LLQKKFKDKDKLIIKEAEKYLPRSFVPGEWVIHTLKNNIFIPTSGIDESNANGHFILWPKNPKRSAEKIRNWLKKKYKVKILVYLSLIRIQYHFVAVLLAFLLLLPDLIR